MISRNRLVRIATLVLTLIVAAACLLIGAFVLLLSITTDPEYAHAGLMMSVFLGGPPLLTAALLVGSAVALWRGKAGRVARIVAGTAGALTAVCAFVTQFHGPGTAFALLFLMVALLLASPLALRSPGAAKPPKS
ncbi:MAG: hypothetical protein EBR82_07785 [Caulobacteraceae bacterium]|nr:hypothetical protein [Caulobacteraceae bacterium]